VAFLGGINISKVYGSGSSRPSRPADQPIKDRPWRDTQVELQGPVVAQLQHAFLEQWAKVRKEAPLTDAALYPQLSNVGKDVVRAMPGSPDDGVDPSYIALISAIEAAATQVRITNAYFVPARELLEALERAARRGVAVELILPGYSDNWLVTQAGHAYYEDLLEAGVKIYERKNRLLHAKTAVVDGVWSTIGSTNLDWRSLTHNDELNAVVLGPDFAAGMDAMFDKDRALSTPITRESWAERPITDRVKEQAARCWALLL